MSWLISRVVPGADLGLWNRPPNHMWKMEWRKMRSQRIAERNPVSSDEPTEGLWDG